MGDDDRGDPDLADRPGWEERLLDRLGRAEARAVELEAELAGERKARELLLKGLESQAELMAGLKQRVRALEEGLRRLMSNVWGQEEGDPEPFAGWADALVALITLLDGPEAAAGLAGTGGGQ